MQRETAREKKVNLDEGPRQNCRGANAVTTDDEIMLRGGAQREGQGTRRRKEGEKKRNGRPWTWSAAILTSAGLRHTNLERDLSWKESNPCEKGTEEAKDDRGSLHTYER